MSGAIPALEAAEETDGAHSSPAVKRSAGSEAAVAGRRWPWRVAALGWALFLWWALESPPGELPLLPEALPWVPLLPGDKLAHALLFLLTAWLFHRANPHPRRPLAVALGLALVFGLVTELHQLRVPGRSAELADVLGNGLGCGLYGLLARWRQR